MKKFFSVIFVIILTVSLMPTAFATEDNGTQVRFSLTSDYENVVSKQTGDIVTVTCTLENISDENASFMITNIAAEIYFDHEFFEFVGVKENPLGLNTSHQTAISKDQYVLFNKGFYPAVEFDAKQVFGTFELKVIATSGSNTVRIVQKSAKNEGVSYQINVEDLIVNIGGAVAPTQYRLVFDTNGGRTINDVVADEGTVIDLSSDKYNSSECSLSFIGSFIIISPFSCDNLLNIVSSLLFQTNEGYLCFHIIQLM